MTIHRCASQPGHSYNPCLQTTEQRHKGQTGVDVGSDGCAGQDMASPPTDVLGQVSQGAAVSNGEHDQCFANPEAHTQPLAQDLDFIHRRFTPQTTAPNRPSLHHDHFPPAVDHTFCPYPAAGSPTKLT